MSVNIPAVEGKSAMRSHALVIGSSSSVWYGNPQVREEWRHWKNVDPVNQRIENATDFPKSGAYDSHDPTVVDQQAEAAHDAGITGFIASWWGRDSFEDRGMPILLAAAGAEKGHSRDRDRSDGSGR